MYYRIGAVHTITGGIGRRTLESQLVATEKGEISVNTAYLSLLFLYFGSLVNRSCG